MIVAALGVLACSTGFAQDSLCNPCVDPPNLSIQRDLRSLEQPQVVPFDLGAPYLGMQTLTLVESLRDVDEALLDTARAVMPPSMTDVERADAIRYGLWREDRQAVAVTMSRTNATLAFVFVHQADGSYAGADATAVISGAAFGSFGWPAEEYERYAITLSGWDQQDGDPSLLRALVTAWRQGQRHSTSASFFISPDGSIRNP